MSETTPSSSTGQGSFLDRFVGALKLDGPTYDEVEHDPNAMGQAAGVVVIGAIATAIGASASEAGGSAIGSAIGALLGWLVSAWFVWFIGVRWLDHTSDYPELLRTLGFASAPYAAMVLAIIPLVGRLVAIAVFFWGLAAYVIAVREALDVETGRSVIVCLLAYGLKILTVLILVAVLGGLGALLGAGT